MSKKSYAIKKRLAERLLAKCVRADNGCLLWTGVLSKQGYGYISVAGGPNGRTTKHTHRLSYEEFVGPIPEGMQVDHECHNLDRSCCGGRSCLHRRCFEPTHLRLATPKQNIQASGRVGLHLNDEKLSRDCCSHGHTYTPDNLYFRPSRSNCRECKTCMRDHLREYKREQRRKQGKVLRVDRARDALGHYIRESDKK